MITALAVQWLLTAVFAAAGLTAALPRRASAGSLRRADRFSAILCCAMCAALIFMTWRSEPAAAVWLQAAAFGCGTLWLALALLGSDRARQQAVPVLLHVLTAAAMIWMLVAMPPMTWMASPESGAMTAMSRAAPSTLTFLVSGLLAVACAVVSIEWLVQAINPGSGPKDPVSTSNAAMSAAMAAMLFATL